MNNKWKYLGGKPGKISFWILTIILNKIIKKRKRLLKILRSRIDERNKLDETHFKMLTRAEKINKSIDFLNKEILEKEF